MKISSPKAMIEFWITLAKDHKIILLQWDLGAGKTLLTKWFARWLGIDDHLVQSPTYAYINIYENKLLHIDMYRLESYEDIVEKWILAQMHEHDYIVIEWPKFIDQLGLTSYTLVDIKKTSEDERIVEFSNIGM
jgi:tRNA threonylcarbamoyladenosine biosynthesis protein TsaE